MIERGEFLAELGLHAAVCYHFSLEMSSERKGKTVQPGAQGYRGGWYVLGSCDTNWQGRPFCVESDDPG